MARIVSLTTCVKFRLGLFCKHSNNVYPDDVADVEDFIDGEGFSASR